MYNRYVPTADGTYRRQIVPSAPQTASREVSVQQAEPPQQPTIRTSKQAQGSYPTLPIRLETGDLLVLLILLLVLLEGEETDTMTILVTLAAFLLLQ